MQSVNVYYRTKALDLVGPWIALGQAGRAARSLIATLPLNNNIAGNYQVLVAPDNVDPAGLVKIPNGQVPKCIADGWPIHGIKDFRVLLPYNVQPYKNPFPPNVAPPRTYQ